MTSHSVRTVGIRFVGRLLVATVTVVGPCAAAQVLTDGPAAGWAEERLPGEVVTDGGWTDGADPESFAMANDGLSQSAALDACPPTDACGHGCPWRWRAEALALWRSSPRTRPLFANVVDGAVAGTALDADQLISDPLAAPRLSLFRDDGCGPIYEANYLWAGNFYSERSLPFVTQGYATSPPGLNGTVYGPDTGTSLNAAQAKLLANLQTAELNVRERFLHGLAQFLIGFRWLQWNETLQMQDAFTNPDDPTVTGADFYRTDCFNNLYGGQIGIDAVLYGSPSGFRIDGLVKAGAFYNDALQKSEYAYVDTSPDAFAAANRVGSPDGAAFVGEVGMTAVFPVHCNLDLRVGYFGLWIEGLAQPTNQLSGQDLTQGGSDAGSLDLTGGVLLQGLSLGLEGRW